MPGAVGALRRDAALLRNWSSLLPSLQPVDVPKPATGKLPEGIVNFQAMYLRYQARTFTYAGFMREEYPPFAFTTASADPGGDRRVRVEFAQLEML